MNETYHIPALLNETIKGLDINPDGIYIDATFGGGGHSKAIFDKLSKKGKLIAFDQDKDALANAWKADNFILINSNFAYIKNFVEFLKIEKVDGILADLGISTHHIDKPERGFSFRFNAKLDMRMNNEKQLDAHYIVNNYKTEKLTEIFRKYSNLKNAKQIANAIDKARKVKKIDTTFDLIESIKHLAPRNTENKFYAQVFQAIRIEVNDEMGNLKTFLEQATELLKTGGRIAIISYHSIEDKLVKNYFRNGNFEGKRITDMYGNQIRKLKPLNNKVIVPDEKEIETNNRARSAKLRIAEKL